MSDAAGQGRRAFEQRAWDDAYNALSRASATDPLGADDVERLAWSATLTGRDEPALDAFERLHQLRLDAGDDHRAARAAFWLALRAMTLGQTARASGWLGRAERLVDPARDDCAECGYLRLPRILGLTAAGDHVAARTAAAEVATIGDRFKDPDLSALGRDFQGRAMIRDGRLSEGLRCFDEAMVAATCGELSPIVTGLIYCDAIAACQQTHALDRAREWTMALSGWCEAQPQLVPFAATCLVHRSEVMQLGGAWTEAFEEARRASIRLSHARGGDAGHAAPTRKARSIVSGASWRRLNMPTPGPASVAAIRIRGWRCSASPRDGSTSPPPRRGVCCRRRAIRSSARAFCRPTWRSCWPPPIWAKRAGPPAN